MEKKAVEEAEEKAGKEPQAEVGRLVRICIAAWLIPGCGHFLLGRKRRALILFGAILCMFLLGLAMQGQFFNMHSGSILQTLGFFGEMCVGVLMPAAMFFGYSGGNGFYASADYGTAFLVTAGMLNALTIFDAYDIALGRKN